MSGKKGFKRERTNQVLIEKVSDAALLSKNLAYSEAKCCKLQMGRMKKVARMKFSLES